MSVPRKLRILCLHGMVQNATVFRKKTAVIRKKLDAIAELVYVTAPHLIVDPRYTSEAMREAAADANAPEESKPFGWWQPTSDNVLTPDGYYQGFKESLQHVKNILIKDGPFDAIFGFSQGACLAAIVTELLENKAVMPELMSPDFAHPPFRFAIICAGFKPLTQEATQKVFSEKIKTPSLHMLGEQDTLITPERAILLAEAFENPAILKHAGGHVVPSNAPSRNELVAFVSKFTPTSSN
ncbi:serine hydrolase FSH [Radiomyces spectabilis]|uniref:serine hydrolase FSH n=1 Tax=Radiomyces spectabilis TaxID=64574 RepID=UPI002220A601|nr:serine hydrolase FSH [Radiomyces spectabilis]KAI8373181.1 serine hydrolase FSH [Radiomyces spectabilis]